MNQKTGIILTTITVVICGLPGMFACLGGSLVAGFGLLADKTQLKLDTNLDKVSVIWNGLGGICLGVILIAIPTAIWLWSKRH
jgi:drug/metabolite transporter (DMT)-like permease